MMVFVQGIIFASICLKALVSYLGKFNTIQFLTFFLRISMNPSLSTCGFNQVDFRPTLLHIVPFCEGPNKKPEGFAKQKQPAIFAMRHASQLVQHHPSLIYNVP
jgi:hypothetical protein